MPLFHGRLIPREITEKWPDFNSFELGTTNKGGGDGWCVEPAGPDLDESIR